MSSTTCGDAPINTILQAVLRVLPVGDASAFEMHVRACAACRAEVDALRPVIEAFTDWPADVLRPPTSLWPRLAHRIGGDSGVKGPDTACLREPPWRRVAPGISCTLLSTDNARRRATMLARLAPGVAYPPHSDAGIEELHLLDGEFWVNDRKLVAGDYSRAEAETADTRM